MDMRGRFGVEGDRVGAGPGELIELAVGLLDHQVDVQHTAAVVDQIGDRGGDQWTDRDRRNEGSVHHVEVDDPGAGVHDLFDRRAEPGEIGREDRRRDPDPVECFS